MIAFLRCELVTGWKVTGANPPAGAEVSVDLADGERIVSAEAVRDSAGYAYAVLVWIVRP